MKKTAICILLIHKMLVFGQPANNPGEVNYFTDNGLSASVKIMQHPAGIYHDDVTYICYQGPLEDPYVAAYNHRTSSWEGPVKVGTSVLGKTPGAKIDNHGKPCMVIDNEGYIHIVFGGHGGLPEHGKNTLGDTHGGKMQHVVSTKKLDISSWEVLDNVPPFGTYNQFVKMDNGDIYLFYRHGAHKSNWVFQKSTDNCRTFEPEVSILKHQMSEENTGVHDSWYCWVTKGQGDEIIMTYNYHVCKSPNHDGERKNCYYMVMNTNDFSFRNVRGELLNIPVTKSSADEMTLVVNSGKMWTNRGTVRLDENGFPHLVYYEGEHMGLRHGGPQQAKYYRWTGHEWEGGYETDLPLRAVCDMRVISPTEVSLLMDGRREVAWWHSSDGGKTFARGDVLISTEKGNFNMTSLFDNAHPDAYVIAAGEKHTSEFRYMYLLGDNGPVKRPKKDAVQLQKHFSKIQK